MTSMPTHLWIRKEGVDVTEECSFKNGRGNPFGWSQHELWHADRLIGTVDSGDVQLSAAGYTWETTEDEEEEE